MLQWTNISLISPFICGLLQDGIRGKAAYNDVKWSEFFYFYRTGAVMEITQENQSSLNVLCNNYYKKGIYTIYTQDLVMVILLQLDKTELYKTRMAVRSWQ